jgi:hypothetical protein
MRRIVCLLSQAGALIIMAFWDTMLVQVASLCSCSWSNDVVVREKAGSTREKEPQEEKKELTFLRTFRLDQSANAPSLEPRCQAH